MNNTGLFGGTFDPVHNGHLIVAQSILELLKLEKILFIPSARPPHKRSEIMFPAEIRFKMLEQAIRGNPRFEVSDIEIKRTGPSFTIDTIREIKATMNSTGELLFIVGRDNLPEISGWKEPGSLLEKCRIIVADRPSNEPVDIPVWLQGKVETVKVPLIDISSSEIRDRIKTGKSIRYLVPDDVLKIIENTV